MAVVVVQAKITLAIRAVPAVAASVVVAVLQIPVAMPVAVADIGVAEEAAVTPELPAAVGQPRVDRALTVWLHRLERLEQVL